MITSRMSAYTVANEPLRTVRRAWATGSTAAQSRLPKRPSTAACHSGTRAASGRPTRSLTAVLGAQRIVEQPDAERQHLRQRGGDARAGVGIAGEGVEQRVGMAEVIALLAHRPGGDVADTWRRMIAASSRHRSSSAVS